jgi:hypothetical protein
LVCLLLFGDAELSDRQLTEKRPRKLQCFEWNVHKIVALAHADGLQKMPFSSPQRQDFAKLHHALTSDRAAAFAAVAAELVTLLDLDSNSGHGQTQARYNKSTTRASRAPQVGVDIFISRSSTSASNIMAHFIAL